MRHLGQLASHPLTPWLLFAAVFFLQFALANPRWGGPGLTWDETYYLEPFEATAAWAALVLSDPAAAFTRESIFAHWEPINELPPVHKWIGAASLLLPGEGWNRLWLLRIPSTLMFAGTIVLLFLVARRHLGPGFAVLVPVLYLLQPRVVAHGQLAATETLFAFLTMLLVWGATYPWGGRREIRRWLWLTIFFGLLLATKFNAFVTAIALLIWCVSGPTCALGRWRGSTSLLLAPIGGALAAALLAFMIWPWLWIAPVDHGRAYLLYFLDRPVQGLWYFGQRMNFGGPPAPMTYPLVITHLVNPLGLLLIVWAGLTGAFVRLVRRRRIPAHVLLWALLFLGPFAASSLPNTPRYDGIRLFLPAFSPGVLVVGWGLKQLWLMLRRTQWSRPALAALAVLLILSLPLARPALHRYNQLAHLLQTGPRFPFEVTYWAEGVTPRFVADLNDLLPENARVRPLAMHGATFIRLQDWGLLRDDIDFRSDPPYDAHLIQNRRGFWGNAEWSIFGGREPIKTWGEGPAGEPLLFLFDGRPPGS